MALKCPAGRWAQAAILTWGGLTAIRSAPGIAPTWERRITARSIVRLTRPRVRWERKMNKKAAGRMTPRTASIDTCPTRMPVSRRARFHPANVKAGRMPALLFTILAAGLLLALGWALIDRSTAGNWRGANPTHRRWVAPGARCPPRCADNLLHRLPNAILPLARLPAGCVPDPVQLPVCDGGFLPVHHQYERAHR